MDMFELGFTWPTDQTTCSFPSNSGSSTHPWYTVGAKVSDKNLEKWINIKSCMKIGRSASEMLTVLTLAYGDYDMKWWSVFEWHRQLKEWRQNVWDDQRSEQPKNANDRCNCGRIWTFLRSDRRLGVRLIAEESYGNLFGGKDSNGCMDSSPWQWPCTWCIKISRVLV
jgi:hypothetical protein